MLAVRRDPKMLENPDGGGEDVPEPVEPLPQGGDRVSVNSRHQAHDVGLWADGFPVGLAAWIVEKFHSWTDNQGSIETAVSRDDLLTNITLYWATGAIGSSFWPYYAARIRPGRSRRTRALPRDRLRSVSQGDPTPAAVAGRANLRQYSAVDRDEKGRALRGARTARGLGARNTGVLQAAPLDRFAGSRLGRSGAARTTTTPRPPFYRAKRAVPSIVGECWHRP